MIEQRQAGVPDNDAPGGQAIRQATRSHLRDVDARVGARSRRTRVTTGLRSMIAAIAWLPIVATAQAPAPAAKPDPAKAEKVAQDLCAACHGPDGNSTAPANPKLAGQHPEYLYKQLKEFKVQEGGKTALRNNAVMTGMVANLSDADMHNLAAFYAGKTLKPSAAKNKDTVDLGRSIYRGGIADKGVPACAGCHGPRGEGMPAQYPLLHGQYSDYTEAQLAGFRSGTRANNATMTAIAARLSDNEIKAVADYVAGLR